MIKKVLLTIAAVLCSAALFAQRSDFGGVTGTVVNRAGRAPIADAELRRELSNSARLDIYRRKFLEEPHLEIKLEDMNMSFDLLNIVPLDEDEGTVYHTIQISDRWGILTVEGGGALLRSDWRWVIVSEPLEITEERVTGEGWIIELNEGYFIEETPAGDYLMSKKK